MWDPLLEGIGDAQTRLDYISSLIVKEYDNHKVPFSERVGTFTLSMVLVTKKRFLFFLSFFP